MTMGLVRERLYFTWDEWSRLPWWQAHAYMEYLRRTADQAAGHAPAEPATPAPAPAPEPEPVERDERVDRALAQVHDLIPPEPAGYDPADDPTPPAPIQPLHLDDTPAPARPQRGRERPGWLPRLPITRVDGFGDDASAS